MNKFKDIVTASRWNHAIFDGKVLLEGRILSPQEAEAAGLTSSLIASQMAPPEHLAQFEKIKKKAEAENADFSELLNFARMINPEGLMKLAEANDKVISACVKRCSMDEGKTWENMKIVLSESEQDPDKNQLWVGLLFEADRTAIIDLCLEGHKAAQQRIAGFLR